MKAKRYCALFVCIAMTSHLLIIGCVSVISQGTLEKTDKTLTFEKLLESPETHKGKTVLLGGSIIETQNYSDKSGIVVLQRPLDFQKKPKDEDISRGRFIVYTPGFLDPAIYRQGRKITVVGTVKGSEVRPIDKIEYSYPVIEKGELHLWPSEENSPIGPRIHFGMGIGIWR